MNLHIYRPKTLWLLFILFVLALIAVFGILVKTVAVSQPQFADVSISKTTVTAEIGNTTVRAKIAKTPEERRAGLSGVANLRDGEGMVFFFNDASHETFWMKDMIIPIDIIWIRGGVVVGVEENVREPLPGTPDVLLPRYTSPVPIDTVLEVPAGFAKRAGIEVGSAASISR